MWLQEYGLQILFIIRMLDTIVTLIFSVLLITTAVLKLLNSRDTQHFKFYLLLATLALFASNIYKTVKYYQGFKDYSQQQQQTTHAIRPQSSAGSFKQPAVIFSKPTVLPMKMNIIKQFYKDYRSARRRGSAYSRTYSP